MNNNPTDDKLMLLVGITKIIDSVQRHKLAQFEASKHIDELSKQHYASKVREAIEGTRLIQTIDFTIRWKEEERIKHSKPQRRCLSELRIRTSGSLSVS